MRSPASWFQHECHGSCGYRLESAALPALFVFSSALTLSLFFGAQFSAFVSRCFTVKSLNLEDKRPKYPGSKEDVANPEDKPYVKYRYQELRKATGGFSKTNLIGEGGFAKVYKAVLPDSIVVAVKRLDGKGHSSDREFKAELDTVGRVKHPNLVALLGFCRTRDWKLLVYEYFENGSLDKFIRDKSGAKRSHLTWPTRLKIMLGAAEGLAYLHSCRPRIIHRDVKASNILLDDKLEAKVSDFGLARNMDISKTHVTTFLAGTRAYIAPEYQSTLRLTVKCDVYSFGIVMLELLTGKDPSRGRCDLVTWVKAQLKGQAFDLFDSHLRESADRDSMMKVLTLALQCTKTAPEPRPCMDEVVRQLSSLYKHAWAESISYDVTSASSNYHTEGEGNGVGDGLPEESTPLLDGVNGAEPMGY